MPLSPLDIHNKEFGSAWRGYNVDEVNEFLDQVIKDYEALIKENQTLEDKVRLHEDKLGHFQHLEETLSKSIIIAQETAEEVKTNARKEAELIVKEAEKNADRIINESLARSRKISIETEELKKRASVYRNRFRTLLEAQLEMLHSNEWDTISELDGE